MKIPKLIEGLKMLEKQEWISFRKYILMYCTKSSDNYLLLDYLFKNRNKMSEFSDAEKIRKGLFDKMAVKNFSNLMSHIFVWFEEWLVWHEHKKEDNTNDIQLVKIYNRKGVFSLADKTYRRVEKNIVSSDQLDLRKHKDLYLLHHYHYFSDNPVKYKRKGEILESLVSYFTLQFKEQAILYISEMHNWGHLQNHDFSNEIEMLTQIGLLVKDSQTSEVVELIAEMVSKLDENAFIALREVIYSNRLKPGSDLYIIASLYLITFSMRLWNANKLQNSQVVMDIYDFGLESGVLLSTGKIPFIRFINLVTTLGYIKASEKAYEFIDKWKHVVAVESEEAVVALSYAQLKFYEEKYDDIIPYLIGIKYESEGGKMRGILLELIGLYYDRYKNYSLLMNRINNFKRILKAHGSKRSNQAYISFLNCTKVIELLVKRDFIKISIKIENYTPVIFKSWLDKEIKKAGHK